MVKDCFQVFEADRLFQWSCHRKPQRLAEPEGRFQDPPVEATDDQHRRVIVLIGKESEKLDSVHSRHSKVKSDHVGGRFHESLTELCVIRCDHRLEAALARSAGQEVGERRFIIDQQQSRLRQRALLSPLDRVTATRHKVNPMKRLFNRTVHKVPFWRGNRAQKR